MSDIHERARGRWGHILPALGVPSRYLKNKHQDCPICETPKKWFRFDDKDGSGSWICNKCGAGSGVDLVMQKNKLSFLEAVKEIERHIGDGPVRPAEPPADSARLRAQMQRTWNESAPICAGSAAAAYLHRRIGLVSAYPSELRAHGRLYCHEGDGAAPSFRPAMLARVRDGQGRPVTVHRTYLTHEGGKAAIAAPKRLMRSCPLPDACAIRLSPVAETLGVAEGVETALSATVLFGTPCWSLLSTAMMARWSPPEGVRRMVIYADRDEEYIGQQAAIELYHRLRRLGVEVSIQMPEEHGQDWNDVLMAGLAPASAEAA